MIYLILSILSSVGLYLVFKLIAVHKIPLLPVILVNYGVCVLLGSLVLGPNLLNISGVLHTFSLHYFGLLGLLFVVIFVLMGKTTAHFGISVTSVATKMALVIPALFFFFTDDASPQWMFWPGLLLSIPGLFLLVYSQDQNHPHLKRPYWIPIWVWMGSGLIDTLLKISETQLSGLPKKEIWLSVVIFLGALLSGLLYWIFLSNKTSKDWSKQVFKYGVLLGIPNFGSIGFLLLAMSSDFLKSSLLFPINNLGIVLMSIWVSRLAFYVYRPIGIEDFSARKRWGMFLALCALALLSFSN